MTILGYKSTHWHKWSRGTSSCNSEKQGGRDRSGWFRTSGLIQLLKGKQEICQRIIPNLATIDDWNPDLSIFVRQVHLFKKIQCDSGQEVTHTSWNGCDTRSATKQTNKQYMQTSHRTPLPKELAIMLLGQDYHLIHGHASQAYAFDGRDSTGGADEVVRIKRATIFYYGGSCCSCSLSRTLGFEDRRARWKRRAWRIVDGQTGGRGGGWLWHEGIGAIHPVLQKHEQDKDKK